MPEVQVFYASSPYKNCAGSYINNSDPGWYFRTAIPCPRGFGAASCCAATNQGIVPAYPI
jgi:hypothetical protein